VIREVDSSANIAGLSKVGVLTPHTDPAVCFLDARNRKLTALFSTGIAKNFNIPEPIPSAR